jgi:adhesin transport system membrane fusion protein
MSGKLKNLLRPRTHSIDEHDLAKIYGDDAPFMTDTNAAVLIGASRTSHFILLGTAAFFLIALIWAAFAELDEVTRGEGKVIPSNKMQVIQNLEGGIVSEILVEEGEIVEKGQPLLRLDDIRFSSSYRESRSKYLSLLAKAARLEAEAGNQPLQMPDSLREEDNDLVDNELALYESRKAELESNLSILKQQESQTKQEMAELEARKNKLARSYALVREELAMSEPLAKEGAISDVEILRLKRSVNDLRGEMDAARLAIPRLQAAHEEVRNKIKDLGISFRTEARAELNDVEVELSAVKESLKSQEDRVSRTLVRSPVKGAVNQIMVTTIGGVIQPGMDLMEIVPLEGTLLVEAHVRPADIAFLRPDQNAKVKLTAYDYAIYGGLEAKLEHISADTITDEDGESYYLIRVRTERSFLGSEENPLEIIPGMTATVDILTGEKTVLDYLLKPVLRARERALRER